MEILAHDQERDLRVVRNVFDLKSFFWGRNDHPAGPVHTRGYQRYLWRAVSFAGHENGIMVLNEKFLDFININNIASQSF